MKTVYFDCSSGISGDMVLGALVDSGLDFPAWLAGMKRLGLGGYTVTRRRVKRGGLAGTKLTVRPAANQPRRNLADIKSIINSSAISPASRKSAVAIFTRLARAEAAAHGTTPGRVHFHEVGAVDAIIDITGSVVALEMLGVGRVLSSALNLGSGMARGSHGTFPVPAPATANLIKGVPVYGSDTPHELTTPTGAAIITTLAEGFGPMPLMAAESVGSGAGDTDIPGAPNLLRVFISGGEGGGGGGGGCEGDEAVLIQTNIDDMDPRLFEHVMERLFEGGALDVWLTPVTMKKSRPATALSALSAPSKAPGLVDMILKETTTFGVRINTAQRKKLKRETVKVKTPHGTLRVKLGKMGDAVIKAVPEYEDAKRLAKKTRKPIADIIRDAVRMTDNS